MSFLFFLGESTVFFPTLTCGVFVFSSVSARPPPRPPPPAVPPSRRPPHSHSLHSLTHSHTHTLTHSQVQLLRGRRGTISTATGSDVPWRPLVLFGLRSFCVAGVAQSPPPRGRMYALASPGAVWSPQLLRGRRGTISTAKGSDVRPGVPWCCLVSATFAWQAWHNLHCQGVGCTPWRPLVLFGLRSFCVASVAPSPLPRGRMYGDSLSLEMFFSVERFSFFVFVFGCT